MIRLVMAVTPLIAFILFMSRSMTLLTCLLLIMLSARLALLILPMARALNLITRDVLRP